MSDGLAVILFIVSTILVIVTLIFMAGADSPKKEHKETDDQKHKPQKASKKKTNSARQSSLKSIDLVSASQIGVSVIELFNRKELLDITAALETQKEIEEAIQIIHEKLRPEYQKRVRIWYQTEHAIAESALTTVAIEASVDEAMEKGLIALRKSEDIATLFDQTPKGAAARPIEKKKTWSEIADGH